MPIAYKISNLVISASIEPEAFGRVAVEAQSMCKPIIATNLGGSKETIVNEKTGILIESGNSNILADTIYKLMMMDDKTLEIMGLEGRKNVLKKFDVEKMCNSTFTEYKKLIQ
jgi:glycosyltransferase involved in cell wall biosynthesis